MTKYPRENMSRSAAGGSCDVNPTLNAAEDASLRFYGMVIKVCIARHITIDPTAISFPAADHQTSFAGKAEAPGIYTDMANDLRPLPTLLKESVSCSIRICIICLRKESAEYVWLYARQKPTFAVPTPEPTKEP